MKALSSLGAYAPLLAIVAVACGTPERETGPDFGKAAANPTVTAATPASATQDTTLDVQISGSGFDSGSAVQFLNAGAADARVRTNSTRYVSASSVVANVTIAADAAIATYDVAVTTRTGKKGIGSDLFTVSNATSNPRLRITLAPSFTVDAETVTAGIRNDPYGYYSPELCGTRAMINELSVGVVADALFDADQDYRRSMPGCPARRTLSFALPGGTRADAPYVVLHGLNQITVLNAPVLRDIKFDTDASASGCESIMFGASTLGNTAPATITLVDEQPAAPYHTWIVQSQAPHQARCTTNSRTGASIVVTLPFQMTIRQLDPSTEWGS